MNSELPRSELHRLLAMEPNELSDVELATLLCDQYAEEPVPPCPVCGGELSVASCGGASATIYACSEWEDDSAKPGELRRKDGCGVADDHYSRSRWTQYRGGDTHVLELVRRFAAA